jgi:hypothetical protein
MTKDRIISLGVLLLGLTMLFSALCSSPVGDIGDICIAGSVLVGSWLISRSITNSNKL